MNENINLYEILKDCPKGTPLYCSIFGDVKFAEICNTDPYGVVVTLNNGGCVSFSKDGLFSLIFPNAECVLFPSKEQRDWSKFNPKGNALSVEDVFSNTVDAITSANRAKEEENERLDLECMAFTSDEADRFINEFSFLKKHGFTLERCPIREGKYFSINPGRLAYFVKIKRGKSTLYSVTFPMPGTMKKYELAYYRFGDLYKFTFEEFAKFLAKQITPSL